MKKTLKESAAREGRVWGWVAIGLIVWIIIGAVL